MQHPRTIVCTSCEVDRPVLEQHPLLPDDASYAEILDWLTGGDNALVFVCVIPEATIAVISGFDT